MATVRRHRWFDIFGATLADAMHLASQSQKTPATELEDSYDALLGAAYLAREVLEAGKTGEYAKRWNDALAAIRIAIRRAEEVR